MIDYMFLLKVMGFLDILAAAIIMLYTYDLVTGRVLISFIMYLVIKGLMFKGDFASFVDFLIAIYMIIMFFASSFWISLFASLYLLQKGFSSLF